MRHHQSSPLRIGLSAIAILLFPALCGASDTYYVKRNGCFYRVQRPYVAQAAVAVAPTQSAGQAIAALAGKKAEWAFITESISQIFGTPGSTTYASDYNVQRGNTVYGANSGYSLQSFATVTPQPLNVEALMERATRLANAVKHFMRCV
jgi:hypothetical protein